MKKNREVYEYHIKKDNDYLLLDNVETPLSTYEDIDSEKAEQFCKNDEESPIKFNSSTFLILKSNIIEKLEHEQFA